MKPTTYQHPKYHMNRLIQYSALALSILLVITAPLQVLLTLAGAPGGLFVCSAFFTLILALPLLMLTALTPTVTVTEDALIVQPTIWKSHTIGWGDIAGVKVFPLLPQETEELTRRIFVGRQKYRPAQGVMLVLPSLPIQYRIAGFLAGAGSQPIIALTNRAHQDYDQLLEAILTLTNSDCHDEDLRDEG